MTYFADLTPYTYRPGEKNTYNIGWLTAEKKFSKGKTSKEFQEILTDFCQNPPQQYATCGYHPCEFCGRILGGSEIRIVGDEKIFAAPVLIFHYVITHSYRPPQEFIDAVMSAPLPDSDEVIERYGRKGRHAFPKISRLEGIKWGAPKSVLFKT